MKKLLALALILLLALPAAAFAEADDTLVVTALTSAESFDPHTAN